MHYTPCPKRKGQPWTSGTVCLAKGCHIGCKEYHRHTERLPEDMAIYCKYFSLRHLEDHKERSV
jgi:hypothetical protein